MFLENRVYQSLKRTPKIKENEILTVTWLIYRSCGGAIASTGKIP